MELSIETVRSKSALKEFIYLPRNTPNGRNNWVPPIWSDEFAFHDPKANPTLHDCITERWLVRRNGRAVGRVMGIIHKGYNSTHKERTGRFYALECVEDPAVSSLLLSTVEKWARDHGMENIIGPFGFSDKDPEGIQIEGFEHRPVVATATNAPFLESLIQRGGYLKFKDCLVYRLDVPDETPELYTKVAERVIRQYGLKSLEFTSRIQLRKQVIPVFRLLNEAYRNIYGFVPLSEAEMKKLRDTYLPILNPRYVKMLVDTSGTPAAFVIAVPDFSEGLQKANGNLLPFGFLKIFSSMRRTRQLDLLLGAVRPDLQGKGLTAALAVMLFRDARKGGFAFMDSHLVLESNTRMRAELERIGGYCYKRYRIFEKKLV
ncbi:MAG: hypothetical protein ACKO1U_06595 [Bacteroidota bacterium]